MSGGLNDWFNKMRAVRSHRSLRLLVSLAALTSVDLARGQEASPRSGVRDVTPPGTSRILRSEQDLTRPDDNARAFENTLVLRDGSLRSGSTTIQLYGIKLPDRKKLCTTLSGARWACGSAAYVALRNLVQSQTIRCTIKGETGNEILATCRVQRIDISASLLQQGWAELTSDTKEKIYVDALANSKAKSAGLWGDGSATSR
jgi:endonuclease YncB( thermonuclease family)